MFDDVADCVDALLDAQVGLFLSTVAEDFEFLGVGEVFLNEVRDDVPAQVWTDDVGESEHPRGEIVGVGVG